MPFAMAADLSRDTDYGASASCSCERHTRTRLLPDLTPEGNLGNKTDDRRGEPQGARKTEAYKGYIYRPWVPKDRAQRLRLVSTPPHRLFRHKTERRGIPAGLIWSARKVPTFDLGGLP